MGVCHSVHDNIAPPTSHSNSDKFPRLNVHAPWSLPDNMVMVRGIVFPHSSPLYDSISPVMSISDNASHEMSATTELADEPGPSEPYTVPPSSSDMRSRASPHLRSARRIARSQLKAQQRAEVSTDADDRRLLDLVESMVYGNELSVHKDRRVGVLSVPRGSGSFEDIVPRSWAQRMKARLMHKHVEPSFPHLIALPRSTTWKLLYGVTLVCVSMRFESDVDESEAKHNNNTPLSKKHRCVSHESTETVTSAVSSSSSSSNDESQHEHIPMHDPHAKLMNMSITSSFSLNDLMRQALEHTPSPSDALSTSEASASRSSTTSSTLSLESTPRTSPTSPSPCHVFSLLDFDRSLTVWESITHLPLTESFAPVLTTTPMTPSEKKPFDLDIYTLTDSACWIPIPRKWPTHAPCFTRWPTDGMLAVRFPSQNLTAVFPSCVRELQHHAHETLLGFVERLAAIACERYNVASAAEYTAYLVPHYHVKNMRQGRRSLTSSVRNQGFFFGHGQVTPADHFYFAQALEFAMQGVFAVFMESVSTQPEHTHMNVMDLAVPFAAVAAASVLCTTSVTPESKTQLYPFESDATERATQCLMKWLASDTDESTFQHHPMHSMDDEALRRSVELGLARMLCPSESKLHIARKHPSTPQIAKFCMQWIFAHEDSGTASLRLDDVSSSRKLVHELFRVVLPSLTILAHQYSLETPDASDMLQCEMLALMSSQLCDWLFDQLSRPDSIVSQFVLKNLAKSCHTVAWWIRAFMKWYQVYPAAQSVYRRLTLLWRQRFKHMCLDCLGYVSPASSKNVALAVAHDEELHEPETPTFSSEWSVRRQEALCMVALARMGHEGSSMQELRYTRRTVQRWIDVTVPRVDSKAELKCAAMCVIALAGALRKL